MNFVQRRNLVSISLVNVGKNWDVVAQVQQDVELHRSLSLLPASPGKQGQTQVDHRRVQGEQVRFQAQFERCIGVQPPRPPHQHRRHFRENTPIAMFVCVSQIRAGHPPADSQVIVPGRAPSEAGFDAAQSLAVSQLREDHRRKMVVDTERARSPRHRESRRRTLQLVGVHTSENLSEDGRGRIHRRARMAQIAVF